MMRASRICIIPAALLKPLLICLLLMGLLLTGGLAEQELDLAPVEKWLERMKGIKTIEATFVQQKYLRTLRSPLTSNGHLWLQYPDDFRWELGDPPATIAVRHQDILTILKPKKKQAQLISLAPEKAGNGTSVPASMHSIAKTFPRSMEELVEHFDILNIEVDDKVYQITLKPKDQNLTTAMRRVVFFIDAEKYYLRAFEIQFQDKSRVRTTFTRIKFNPTIPAELLKPDLKGYKVSDHS